MTEVRAVQPENANEPIDKALGIVTEVRLMQPLNAPSPINVKDVGAMNTVAALQL